MAQDNLLTFLYLDLLGIGVSTLVFVASDDIATTYENYCPPTPTLSTPTPAQTAPSHLSAPQELPRPTFCANFTMFQGPSTWGLNRTITRSNLQTYNGDCTWTGSGAFTAVPITCDADAKGEMYGREFSRGTPVTFQPSELSAKTNGFGFAVATVVSGTETGTTGSSMVRETGEGNGGEAEATGTGTQGMGTQTGSQAMAGRAPFPTGVVAMVGSAFVVGAAAWVL
ncbi:hypothetical protein ACJQWK_01983 [Exserohilum turcicum]|uniref:Uncharacterized protein n=1 Tax=Exserohilum turcicum (strain 28A) TaxID=671987 RepID=R0KL48_EXST2|nr:uncharacterized protein SETTUDRAFT_38711 [Exserohilum turcica Et28A]EOA88677.1 hypothetical protein SETTUDRAFT_38711 [Exserohilum turcica Et28A]